MSIGSEYKEQVDSFANDTYKFSGEEMLIMAKRNNINVTENGTKAKRRGIKKAAVIAYAAAACVGASALTAAAGAAGYGPMASMFRKYHNDETTAKLAEQGYAYTAEDAAKDSKPEELMQFKGIGDTIETEDFAATLTGIAGDNWAPKMLVDIRVKDADVAAANDKIGLYTQCMGPEEFDTRRENFATDYSSCVKDENDSSLYHASVEVPPLWVTSGEETVFYIDSIITLNTGSGTPISEGIVIADEMFNDLLGEDIAMPDGSDMSEEAFAKFNEQLEKLSFNKADMQYRFVVSEDTFKQAARPSYDNRSFEFGGVTYDLDEALYAADNTWVAVHYDFVGTELAGGSENFEEVSEKFDENAVKFSEQLVITVDGKEYKADASQTAEWCDTKGTELEKVKNKCYMTVVFPAIDFDNAKSVTISDGTVTYDLK
ncbi:MAG: hypothetical protein J6M17_05750 [Ruminococcus sp.]|nr:hypothetical protein [Ruminococcus sp.]